MRFGILGPLEVVDDEGRQLQIGAHKQASVLAIMLLHGGELIAAERLADELWGGEAPARAAKTVQVYISRLRKQLPAGLLETRGQSYALAIDADQLDANVFERLVEQGRSALAAGEPAAAKDQIERALALWRGPALSDFTYEPFAQAEIARLEEARLAAIEDRLDADLALGDHDRLISELEGLVRSHPRRERLRGQLMLALYRSGRHVDALESYQSARRELVDGFGIEPSRTLRELNQAMLEEDPALDLVARDDVSQRSPSGPGGGLTNLPPRLRQLVGRAEEVSELGERLRAGAEPLISVTGVGGSGKTRLAMAVGAGLMDWATGGVFLVRLAATRDEQALIPMIAEVLEVTGESDRSLLEGVARRLGQQPTLLILDNLEQLTAAGPRLVELVDQAPQLRVLVTSQVPLRVSGESVFALGPLARGDAVALFLDRARARDRNFEPTEADLADIERICALLDDMPLAIELAAARLASLEPKALLDRLERPLSLLTLGDRDAPTRQQSLRAAIDWTYALLEPEHRAVFARFGVCAGPVPLTMLRAVGPEDTDEPLLDAVAALLDFSFVRRQRDQRLGDRLVVPQALRDYALGRLTAVGGEMAARRGHAAHVLRLARAARLGKWGASEEQRAALDAVSGEIRPAVAWARRSAPGLHAELCAALAAFWVYRGVLAEVVEELRAARASGAGSPADRAWLLTALTKCLQLGNLEGDVRAAADQALAEWNAVDDEVERALGLQFLSWVIRWEARYDAAIEMTTEALAVLRRTGERRLILRGLVFLAHAHADAQDVDRLKATLREADQLADGDPIWELAQAHGDCDTCRGDHGAALGHYVESLRWTSTTGEAHQMQIDMSCLVLPLAELGHAVEALEVFELVRLERERTGRPGDLPTGMVWLREAVAAASAQADPAAAERARLRARAIPSPDRYARAIEIASGTLTADPTPARMPGP
ncbi:MAG TPA: BTAD domain-containing putative transcriptional regulator [Solirubrobacteraceae bacterium]|nr:BTAD domain-containing putative transcriptional regulator [Solirubrobacteraceae bacterium]